MTANKCVSCCADGCDPFKRTFQSKDHTNDKPLSKYARDVSKFQTLDIYRILALFEVTDPCLQHASKKVLCAGMRGAKSKEQDVREAIQSLERCIQMMEEDKQ